MTEKPASKTTSEPEIAACRACGSAARAGTFRAPSNSFVGTVLWTRLECPGHPYVSVRVEGETMGEARTAWNAIMGEATRG